MLYNSRAIIRSSRENRASCWCFYIAVAANHCDSAVGYSLDRWLNMCLRVSFCVLVGTWLPSISTVSNRIHAVFQQMKGKHLSEQTLFTSVIHRSPFYIETYGDQINHNTTWSISMCPVSDSTKRLFIRGVLIFVVFVDRLIHEIKNTLK
jgi:hypothetical protein